jgi:transcriptional regulator with XRE-family HTH domain
LGEQVKRLRSTQDWSQELLAEKAGLTQVYISRIESAKVGASIDVIEALAKALNVEAGALLAR